MERSFDEATFSDDRDRTAKRAFFKCCALSLVGAMVVMCFHGVLHHVVVPEMNKTFSSWSENVGRRPSPEGRSPATPATATSARSSLLRAKRPLPEVILCNTSACLDFSARTAQLLKEAINPCGDFYKYACDSWQHDHALSRQAHYVSTDTVYLKQYVNMLKKALFKPGTIPKLGFLYQVCKKVTGDTLFQRLLSTFLYTLNIGSWPFSTASSRNIPVEDLSYKIGVLKRELGLDSVFGLGVEGDPDNASRIVVSVGQPKLLVERAFTTSWSHLWLDKAFRLLAHSVGKNSTAYSGISRLELRLQSYMVSEQHECSSSCDITDVETLPAIPLVNWTSLFQGLLGVDVRVDRVRITSPQYLLNLYKNWKFDKADILNHIVLRVMILILPFVSDDLLFNRIASWKVSKEHLLPFQATREDQCLHTMLEVEPYMPMELVRSSHLVKLSNGRVTKDVLMGASFAFAFIDHLREVFQGQDSSLDKLFKNIALIQVEVLSPSSLRKQSTRSKYTDSIYTKNPATPLLYFIYYYVKNSAMKRQRPLAASQNETLQVPITAFDLMLPVDPVVELFHLPRVAFRAYRTLSEYVLYYVRAHNITAAMATLESLRLCLKYQSDESVITEAEGSKAGMNPVLDFLAAGSAYSLFRNELSRMAKRVRIKGLEEYKSGQLFAAYLAASFCENASPDYQRWRQSAVAESWTWMRVNDIVRGVKEISRSLRCGLTRPLYRRGDCFLHE
ncbi:hypothetical protein HPB50_012495 [Hyalomma asiaticum]|uniref:Uncharacterized protein n=1 Tax=Hyalomma asiaticum TaxID=266040 RepID=A0ACB7SKE8_HYAAI|nr:hypothetical protein HPB50_012495 [Hyalomma asiaticum]